MTIDGEVLGCADRQPTGAPCQRRASLCVGGRRHFSMAIHVAAPALVCLTKPAVLLNHDPQSRGWGAPCHDEYNDHIDREHPHHGERFTANDWLKGFAAKAKE